MYLRWYTFLLDDIIQRTLLGSKLIFVSYFARLLEETGAVPIRNETSCTDPGQVGLTSNIASCKARERGLDACY